VALAAVEQRDRAGLTCSSFDHFAGAAVVGDAVGLAAGLARGVASFLPGPLTPAAGLAAGLAASGAGAETTAGAFAGWLLVTAVEFLACCAARSARICRGFRTKFNGE
jgi:hypothetical protein